MTLSDGSGQGSLEGNGVLLDRVKGLIGDGDLSVLENGGDANGLPLNGDLKKYRKIKKRIESQHAVRITNWGLSIAYVPGKENNVHRRPCRF